jgi:hypothetical protein
LSSADVYLVPVIDVNWIAFAPLDPAKGYRVEPPPIEQSAQETDALCRLLVDLVGGKYVLTPHSGTYNRIAFYQDAFLDIYRRAIADGAEVALHLHEEFSGGKTRYGEVEHVRTVFQACRRALIGAGIQPTSYRGGQYAFPPYMASLLQENNIFIDLSCAPGVNQPSRFADWPADKLNAWYLANDEQSARAKVFEIPMGADGAGNQPANFLFIERVDLDDLKRIWRTIASRTASEGRPQFVHVLFHTSSIALSDQIEKYKRFMAHTAANGGQFVTPTEALAQFGEISA